MTPAHELLLAYLRRAHEQLVTLRRQRDDLQANLRNMRVSRDLWKEKALTYRRRCKSLDSSVRQARHSRDMWKHRALESALVRRGVVDVDVRPRVVARDGGNGLTTGHLGPGGYTISDVTQPVDAP